MFSGITLPFEGSEMLAAAFDFIGLLGPFILIGLAIALTPRIVSVIKNAVGRGGSRA